MNSTVGDIFEEKGRMAFFFRRLLANQNGNAGDEDSEDDEEDALLENISDSNSSGSDQEGDQEPGNQNHVTETHPKGIYDVTLPARHLYLGDLDEDSSGGQRTIHQDNDTPVLPLLYLRDTIVFPGETLPMHVYNVHMIKLLRDALTNNKPVAICSDLRNFEEDPEHAVRRPNKEELTVLGTTVDIVAFREQEQIEGFHHGPVFIVKFLGRQRFRLLECLRKMNGMMEAKVKILPEELLPPKPFHLFTCPEHIVTSANQSLALLRSCENELQTISPERLQSLHKNITLAQNTISLCQVPLWSFEQIDFHRLREQVKKEQQFKSFSGSENTAKLPNDIVSLSYWLARRLPAETDAKLDLLLINCPTRRILKALQILQSYTDLCCQACNRVIAKKDAIFSMSVEGPLALYVNPGGYVHDTLTVTDATHLRNYGRSSTEHSWFPGYAWTIVNCRRCGDHKGWLFEATRRGLKPHKFYGLRRPSLHFTQANET